MFSVASERHDGVEVKKEEEGGGQELLEVLQREGLENLVQESREGLLRGPDMGCYNTNGVTFFRLVSLNGRVGRWGGGF